MDFNVGGRFPGGVGVRHSRLIREGKECWWGVAKQTDKAVNRDGAHAVITVREGGTEEPSTPADKPQECVGPAAWLTHFMVFKKNSLPF